MLNQVRRLADVATGVERTTVCKGMDSRPSMLVRST